MKQDLEFEEHTADTREEPKDKRGKKRAEKTKPKKTSFLIKRLKLKSKQSPSGSVTQSETSLEPQPSTSSESSPAERQTPEGDDIALAKSASDTNLSESSWKSAENLTAEKKKPISSKSVINVEGSQFEITVIKEVIKSPELRTKSLEDFKNMPAFGELIFDSNMVSMVYRTANNKSYLYEEINNVFVYDITAELYKQTMWTRNLIALTAHRDKNRL